MKSKQILIFSCIEDYKLILQNIEELFSIKYYKTGMFDSINIPKYNSVFDIPNLGMCNFGDWNYNDSYLLIPSEIELLIRKVQLKNGGINYAVDQMLNQKSIVINFGGIYLEKKYVIVAGYIGTISMDFFSLEIYNSFSKKIKKEFKRIENFYVGKEAESNLKNGWRLVTNEKLSKEFDLTL